MADFKMTDEQKALFDKLTKLQRRMALNDIMGMKPAENHKDAGGVCKNEANRAKLASEILNNPDVLAFLDSMKAAAVSSAVMERQEALETLTSMARTNISDLIEWRTTSYKNDEGEEVIQSAWQIKDSALQSPKLMASISELSTGKEGFKLKIHDQKAAIKQISTMQGWDAAQRIETKTTVVDESELDW